MNAFIKEIKDANGKITMALIWVMTPTLDPTTLSLAKAKLKNFIENYIGNRLHTIYYQSEKDTVSAVVIFDLDKSNPEEIEI